MPSHTPFERLREAGLRKIRLAGGRTAGRQVQNVRSRGVRTSGVADLGLADIRNRRLEAEAGLEAGIAGKEADLESSLALGRQRFEQEKELSRLGFDLRGQESATASRRRFQSGLIGEGINLGKNILSPILGGLKKRAAARLNPTRGLPGF